MLIKITAGSLLKIYFTIQTFKISLHQQTEQLDYKNHK